MLELAGQITELKVQKRKRDRVNVYLDGEYAFSLELGVAASLKRGDILSEQEIQDLELRDSVQKAYDSVLNYLAYRPRSGAELRRYLKKRQVSKEVSERVLERLSAAGLMDDEAFARYWVENRETFRPRGRRALRQELRQKGIDDELIAEILNELNEEESARRAAMKQALRYDNLDDGVFRQKMYNFLRRRGFDYEVVRDTISSLLQQRSEEGAERS